MPRVATKRTLTDFHREIGSILREADRLNAKSGPNGSPFAIATAKYAIQDALGRWERIQDQGLRGAAKRQALADINESLERRRSEMRRFFAHINSPSPIETFRPIQLVRVRVGRGESIG